MIIITIIILILDQLTKITAINNLKDGNSVKVIGDFLNLTYVENYGAGFGILQNARWLFIVVTIAVVISMIYFAISNKNDLMLKISIYILIGGAIGNLIDRIFRGYVVDFIDIRFGKLYDFPVFNIADIAVVVGAILLAVSIFKQEKEKKNEF